MFTIMQIAYIDIQHVNDLHTRFFSHLQKAKL